MHFFFSVLNRFSLSHTHTHTHTRFSTLHLLTAMYTDMIQIEHLSTTQVTHIHTTALYKDHYINTAIAIRNTTETSIHALHAVTSRAEQDDWVTCMEPERGISKCFFTFYVMSSSVVLHVQIWISKSVTDKEVKYAQDSGKPKNVQDLEDFFLLNCSGQTRHL